MNGITTITTKGQVTIPSEVRKMLDITIGDKASFTDVVPSERKIVIKIIPANIVDELAGSLHSKVKYTDQKKVRKALQLSLAKKYKIK